MVSSGPDVHIFADKVNDTRERQKELSKRQGRWEGNTEEVKNLYVGSKSLEAGEGRWVKIGNGIWQFCHGECDLGKSREHLKQGARWKVGMVYGYRADKGIHAGVVLQVVHKCEGMIATLELDTSCEHETAAAREELATYEGEAA